MTPREISLAAQARWPGVRLDLIGSGQKWELSAIVVPKKDRGTGIGSAVMEFVVAAADEAGATIVLSPALDYGGSSIDRLRKFYRRFGFVMNKGRTADYALSGGMYRYPKSVNPREFWGSAAAGILFICKDDGMIMLLKRSKKVMEPGTWGLPGGKLEDGEDPWEAAVRETTEEIGVFPRKHALVDTIQFKSDDFTYTSFVLVIPKAEKARIIRDHKLNRENDQMMWKDPSNWDLDCPTLHFGVQHLLKELAKK